MDCSICFEAITKETGHSVLSCSHSFHFCCLAKWFNSQVDKEAKESCPLCRHEMHDEEALPQASDTESEESDESEDDEGGWWTPEQHEQHRAREQRIAAARKLFTELKEEYDPDMVEWYAAQTIQKIWRGFCIRMSWKKYCRIKESCTNIQACIIRCQAREKSNIFSMKFLRRGMEMSRTKWLNLCATKIQAVCRGFLSRKKHNDLTVINALTTGMHIIVSYETDIVRSVSERSWAPQLHGATKRIQALWRGYLIRNKLTALCGAPWWKAGKRVEWKVMNPEEGSVLCVS
jgi:hypothetical protein